MTEGSSILEYRGRKVTYTAPLGIYFDGQITERVHDALFPKYQELDPKKLADSGPEILRMIHADAKRQLREIAPRDTEEARRGIRNTLDLTERLLAA